MADELLPPEHDPCAHLQAEIARLDEELRTRTPTVRVSTGARVFVFDPYNLRAGESAHHVEFEQAAALLRIAADWFTDEAGRAKAAEFPPAPSDAVRDELLGLYRKQAGR